MSDGLSSAFTDLLHLHTQPNAVCRPQRGEEGGHPGEAAATPSASSQTLRRMGAISSVTGGQQRAQTKRQHFFGGVGWGGADIFIHRFTSSMFHVKVTLGNHHSSQQTFDLVHASSHCTCIALCSAFERRRQVADVRGISIQL